MRLLFIFTAVFALTATRLFAQSADETAIKEVLLSAGNATANEPFSKVAQSYWILDANTVLYNSGVDGAFTELHADQMSASTAAPAGAPATVTQTNYLIVVSDKMASATYDQLKVLAGGQKENTHEMVLLEKKDGAWKLHVCARHLYYP